MEEQTYTWRHKFSKLMQHYEHPPKKCILDSILMEKPPVSRKRKTAEMIPDEEEKDEHLEPAASFNLEEVELVDGQHYPRLVGTYVPPPPVAKLPDHKKRLMDWAKFLGRVNSKTRLTDVPETLRHLFERCPTCRGRGHGTECTLDPARVSQEYCQKCRGEQHIFADCPSDFAILAMSISYEKVVHTKYEPVRW
jgi:hypothetical protein